jgi:hypothetical protein
MRAREIHYYCTIGAGTDAAKAIKPKTNTVEYIQETDRTRQLSSNIIPTNQVF